MRISLVFPSVLLLGVTLAPAQAPPRTQVETITITPRGFVPTAISRPAGRVLVSVHNRSGLRQFMLRLDTPTGQRLFDVTVPRERLDWSGFVNAVPGTYVVTEANHPTWVCRITIR